MADDVMARKSINALMREVQFLRDWVKQLRADVERLEKKAQQQENLQQQREK